MTSLHSLLKEEFGWHSFKEGQEEIISAVMADKDVVAVLPTGGGKTLCYQFPSRIKEGMTIVVSPLVSLMEDQVSQLKSSGDKRTAQLNSLLSPAEKRYILANIHLYNMLFVSPEMLNVPYVQEVLKRQRISLFTVDEAHCISQWGHEFRTDYLKLGRVRELLGNPPCLALTATATKKVERDVIFHLNMTAPDVYRLPVNRSNIYISFEKHENRLEKEKRFFDVIEKVARPCIVYTGTRLKSEDTAALLEEKGAGKCAYYHGGMLKEDKILVQQQFLNNEIDIICCTNAFGMGINKPDVRTVIHLHMPSSPEQYVQETGRAGRDGKQSTALLLYSDEDRFLPLSLIEHEIPDKVWLEQVFTADEILGKELNELYADINENMKKMLAFYFEQQGLLENGRFIKTGDLQQKIAGLSDYFNDRKQEKFRQVEAMVELSEPRRCHRERISAYFNEKLNENPRLCCSVCDNAGEYLEEIIPKYHAESTMKAEGLNHDRGWKEALKNILIGKDGGRSDVQTG